MFIARKSDHIQEDIKRNWSSWNFGQEGFEGTLEELEEAKQYAIENNIGFWISGFELWGDEIRKADIRELYPGYWVLVDTVNGYDGPGLFGTELNASTLTDAISESKTAFYFGDGNKFDAREARLVYSEGDIHIFEI